MRYHTVVKMSKFLVGTTNITGTQGNLLDLSQPGGLFVIAIELVVINNLDMYPCGVYYQYSYLPLFPPREILAGECFKAPLTEQV